MDNDNESAVAAGVIFAIAVALLAGLLLGLGWPGRNFSSGPEELLAEPYNVPENADTRRVKLAGKAVSQRKIPQGFLATNN